MDTTTERTSDGQSWPQGVHSNFRRAVMEHWRAPDSAAVTLVMVTQGVMQVEEHRLDRPWEAHTLHPGDLFLHPSVRGAPAERPQRLSASQLQRVVDDIQVNLAQPFNLEALATQAGYSPYHFARLFRVATGASPCQFMLRQRVEGAQQLLREGQLPLLGVALACGFASQSNMNRHFRQHLGVTLGAYQRPQGLPLPPVADRC